MKRRKTGKICMGAAALWLFLLCGCGAEAPRLEDGASSRESAWDASEAEPESREAGAGAEGSGAGENCWEEERKAEGQEGKAGAGDPAEDPGTEAEGTASEPAASADPEEDALQEVTLVMVGDILLHTRVAESGRTEDGGYDFSAVFAQMKEEISQADIALVNQEVDRKSVV